MTLVAGIPGLIALLICLRRGPERALIDVYIPALLLLPSAFQWIYLGHLSFNDTAIIPVAGSFCCAPGATGPGASPISW